MIKTKNIQDILQQLLKIRKMSYLQAKWYASIEEKSKKQSPNAHLADASMLAQTPRTAPVLMNVENSVIIQLSQESLPKNLEENLVHTPYIGAPTTATNSQYSFPMQGGMCNILSTSLQQEVFATYPKGQATLAPQNSANFPQSTNFPNQQISNSESQQSIHAVNMLIDCVPDPDDGNAGGIPDPLPQDICDKVWHLIETANPEDVTFLTEAGYLVPVPSTQTINEDFSISAIQRQSMSFDIHGLNLVTGRKRFKFVQPSVQKDILQYQIVPSPCSQVNKYLKAPPVYTVCNPSQRSQVPCVQSQNVNILPPAQQLNKNQDFQSLSQFGGTANLKSSKSTSIAENKTPKQQMNTVSTPVQRLTQPSPGQWQHPPFSPMPQQSYSSNHPPSRLSLHLPSQPGPSQACEHQKVNQIPSLQHQNPRFIQGPSKKSTSIAENKTPKQQMNTVSTPVQRLTQPSPGQWQHPPFSPMPQQSYSSNHPPSRLSLHLPSQPGPSQACEHQKVNQIPNLQHQNPRFIQGPSKKSTSIAENKTPKQQMNTVSTPVQRLTQPSPGQWQHPPFSPMPQQSYSSNHPPSRLSLHLPSQPGPSQACEHQKVNQIPNLQHQNPRFIQGPSKKSTSIAENKTPKQQMNTVSTPVQRLTQPSPGQWQHPPFSPMPQQSYSSNHPPSSLSLHLPSQPGPSQACEHQKVNQIPSLQHQNPRFIQGPSKKSTSIAENKTPKQQMNTVSTPVQRLTQPSPGQWQHPPFSPMPQQSYSSNHPPSRLSLHLPSQPGPSQACEHQKVNQIPSLQHQNPRFIQSPSKMKHHLNKQQKQCNRQTFWMLQEQQLRNARKRIHDNIPNLQFPASVPLSEGMNDISNTVAPNVTCQQA